MPHAIRKVFHDFGPSYDISVSRGKRRSTYIARLGFEFLGAVHRDSPVDVSPTEFAVVSRALYRQGTLGEERRVGVGTRGKINQKIRRKSLTTCSKKSRK